MKEVKKLVSEKDLLIERISKRIKFKRQNLVKTKKFHREVERDLEKKIRLEVIQLKALK